MYTSRHFFKTKIDNVEISKGKPLIPTAVFQTQKPNSKIITKNEKLRRQSLILGREAYQKVDSPVKEKILFAVCPSPNI